MTILCGACRNGEVAVAADSMAGKGSCRVYGRDFEKILPLEDGNGYIAYAGSISNSYVFHRYFRSGVGAEELKGGASMLTTFASQAMKEVKDQNMVSFKEENALETIIISPWGMFSLTVEDHTVQCVQEFNFVALGVDSKLAYGAMYQHSKIMTDTSAGYSLLSAEELAAVGAQAAIDISVYCGGKVRSKVVKLAADNEKED